MGPTDYTLPVTVSATNDPPVATLDVLPNPSMDPGTGMPVALLRGLTISPGVDADVTMAATQGTVTHRLGWTATVEGVEEVDLLSLTGDTTYPITGNSIISATGTVLATWSRPGADTRTINVTTAAGTTQIQIQEMVRLLRYSHLQSTASNLTRRVTIQVHEPEADGSPATADDVSMQVTVLAQNLPPVVTALPVTLKPETSAPIHLDIQDQDPLADIQVRLVALPPLAGRVEPTTCTASELAAGVMQYTHVDPDQSIDRITLAIDDGHQQVVTVTVPVSIRIPVERMSVISDPCLVAIRGETEAWPMRFTCEPKDVRVTALGGSLPPVPPGAFTDSVTGLIFNWGSIPMATTWLPIRVDATTEDTTVDAAKRTTSQRMLIRVLPAPPVGRAQ